MKNQKVICIGEALVDRLGARGADPANQPFEDCLGGAPANVACALARLGADVAFVGSLGNDKIGHQFRQLFLSRSVDMAGLQIQKEFSSRVVLVRRDVSGERTFGGFLGDVGKGFADQHLALNELQVIWPQLVNGAGWLLLGTILLASPSSKESIFWMLEQAKTNGLQIAIDVNWRPTFWDKSFQPDSAPNTYMRSLITGCLELASLLKVSKEEAVCFFNSQDPVEISNCLPQKPSVIVTDGAKPIRWLLGNCSGETKALLPQSVVDTTGAGDSFTAGLISQLLIHPLSQLSNADAKKIISFAAACGAIVCSGIGAISPQPNRDEVDEFLSSANGSRN